MHLDAAVASAVCGAAGGLVVPTLIRRLPEPTPDADKTPDPEPKEPYADIAGLPGLMWKAGLASAACAAVIGALVGWQWALALLVPVVPVGVALAIIDWRTRLLPIRLVLPATGVAILVGLVGWAVTRDPGDLVRAAIGLVVLRSVFWVLWRLNSAGMGFGDVRLAALLGFALGYLGVAELVVGAYVGFLIFGLPGLLLAVVRRDRKLLKTPYPFGPFMLVGALIGIVIGEPVWSSLFPAWA